MNKTKIEWSKKTWNPVTGCSKITSGCKNCYAERMANRLNKMGNPRYENSFEVTLHPDKLLDPYKWKKPQMIFVNSMSDLFHEDIPDAFIKSVFKAMKDNPQHIFQVLTKRSKRLVEMAEDLPWSKNVWMGVTVENEKVRFRIDDLRKVNANVRFLSVEPLLSALPDLNLKEIDWVIVGGESGPGARQMEWEWVEDIQTQCQFANVPFFFKQWGHFQGNNPNHNDYTDKRKGGIAKGGHLLNGRIFNEYPKEAERVLTYGYKEAV